MIKTLQQALKIEPGEVQSPKVCPAGNPDPADLAGWSISVRDKVFQDLPVFRYQLCHRKQRG